MRLTPVPDGARLLPLPGGERSPSSPGPAPSSRADAPEGASPYGCLISTRDPDGEPYPWRYDDAYLHFPERILRKADGKRALLRLVLKNKDDNTETVRRARCRIPAIEEAVRLVEERLGALPEASKQDTKALQSAAAMQQHGAATSGDHDDLVKYLPDGCKKAVVVGRYREDGSFDLKSVECMEWYTVKESSPPSGGGSGGSGGSGLGDGFGDFSGGGSDGNQCDSDDLGGSSSSLYEEDVCGEEQPVEDPIVIHELPDVYPPATPDEVMDHIREQCAGARRTLILLRKMIPAISAATSKQACANRSTQASALSTTMFRMRKVSEGLRLTRNSPMSRTDTRKALETTASTFPAS